MQERKQTFYMVILGIDPGYAITGYGVISYIGNHFKLLDYGVISTKAHVPFELRLLQISQETDAIIDRFHPEVMAIEELFFSRNTTTAMGTAQARGVLILSGAKKGLSVYEYTPMQVKLSVTGYGRADKNQVGQMVRILLKLEAAPRIDDAADALAIAICQAHTGEIGANRAVSGYQFGSKGQRDFI